MSSIARSNHLINHWPFEALRIRSDFLAAAKGVEHLLNVTDRKLLFHSRTEGIGPEASGQGKPPIKGR
jgi:hypothetical protein